MGFEPRAAERLRLAVASAQGALDDIAGLIGETHDTEEEMDPRGMPKAGPTAAASRAKTRSVA